MKSDGKKLSPGLTKEIIAILKNRFVQNMHRHKNLAWEQVQKKLETNPAKLWSLNKMEISGGEPDVVHFDKNSGEFTFMDCAEETPKGRRSFCYDSQALNSRKEHKPKNSALNFANEIDIKLLNEEQYRYLQKLQKIDCKTSSWIKTPDNIRKLGGALFCDRRFDTVFVYHNGAESYYAARGFRGCLFL